ncbi:hypothetical protein RSOLAG22IIIB_09763 [Rhizoctonia solani]|uniref:Nicotinamide riboside kinase n=1 Tax=Rhizoctonia solani TaxID=456999 RepID=A0A0K6G0E6_9AGAM|nr:hypothetical protein RSOLAG22IIIB_09763 [Rhizoctonia solani]
MSTRVITVGIGGASSAGKSTLAKQLSGVLPNCTVIHQDDYWSSPDECVIHPVYNEPFLEHPSTAIKWPLFRERVQRLKTITTDTEVSRWEESDSDGSQNDTIPDQMDGLSQEFGKLPDDMVAAWTQRFRELDKEWRSRGIQLKWCIVEGWHLYYDPEVVKELDLRLLIRCPSSVLRKRREKRAYKQEDGTLRVDPPYYWEYFTYPAYLLSHSHLFQGELDVGPLSAAAESAGVILLEGEGTKQNLSCSELFERAATSVLLMGRSRMESK